LQTAREVKADMIGLSGLITPSLDEMIHVAKEMERQGFTVPLLIGGATTSKLHTAVKIAPGYGQPVVHVADASRAVGVVGALKSPGLRSAFVEGIRKEQEKIRQAHRPQVQKLLSLEDARRNRPPFDWTAASIPAPSFLGARVFDSVPLEEIVPYVDWSPFFHAWELRGTYPKIFDAADVGSKAKELFDDAQALLGRIVKEKLLTARAVMGFFPANSVGDDIEIYTDESRGTVLAAFHTLRQQMEKASGHYNYALADFVAPKETGLADYLGAFAVTAGLGIEAVIAEFEKDHDDYNAIMTKALADRLAEALAEMLHKRARDGWGYGQNENLSPDDLIHERYRGIRPAPGYPACPDHTEKRLLFDLLQAEEATGIQLTESFAMYPAAAVCGLYFSHPESRYFAVGKIDRDQALDYQRRKGMDLRTVERWLAPILGYEPEETPVTVSG
ncbi:MAG TPA: vitamin B12 dependent-methionine synthase activation domain-containing protein, partial [Terriglobia bacterium]|nr:vitamin B12 dependent-methionine synthase activation domain-containing protein [Terriglobia bacterium]